MLEKPALPKDPHNLAAMNMLLQGNRVSAKMPEDMVSLAILYLTIIGDEHHVADWAAHGTRMKGLSSTVERMRDLHLLPAVSCEIDNATKYCDVKINDLPLEGETRYRRWLLTFSWEGGQLRLFDVEREIVDLKAPKTY
ncbi:MAG: hypothetical protein ABSF98_24770 [Bryobacteraceae bacterium]|jgi:hypothetical protein